MIITAQQRYQGCLPGLAAGDAVGSVAEFKPRDSFATVTDIVGGGKWGLDPGQRTDDTWLALCLGGRIIA